MGEEVTAALALIDALLETEQVVTTSGDTCGECGWILFGGLWGGAWCINESCTEHHVDILAEGVDSPPSPASIGDGKHGDERENDDDSA